MYFSCICARLRIRPLPGGVIKALQKTLRPVRIGMMEEQLRLESGEQIRIRKKRLERNENRIAELKRLFIRIYEDNASGRLSDDRFDMLSLTYETEQKQLA